MSSFNNRDSKAPALATASPSPPSGSTSSASRPAAAGVQAPNASTLTIGAEDEQKPLLAAGTAPVTTSAASSVTTTVVTKGTSPSTNPLLLTFPMLTFRWLWLAVTEAVTSTVATITSIPTTIAEAKTLEPFTQQTLSAWRPALTPRAVSCNRSTPFQFSTIGQVIVVCFVFALCFLGIGVGLTRTLQSVKSIEVRYDHLPLCQRTPSPSALLNANASGVNATAETPDAPITRECHVTFSITEDLKSPLFFYYSLSYATLTYFLTLMFGC